MSRVKRVNVAMTALFLLVIAGITHAKAESIERIAAIPPAAYVGATIFGMPVTSLTQWVFFLYAVSLLAWHIKTKWLSKKPELAE